MARLAEIIAHNTRIQARLINDQFDLTRMALGKLQLSCVPIRIDLLAASLVEQFRLQAEESDLTLRVHALPEAWVLADPERLRKILSNLLSNAIKYTRPRGTVSLSLLVDHRHARLIVADTGIGISTEVLGNLNQGDQAPVRQGLGIGLTLVKQLVELHGGTIHVQSDGPDTGSRFTVVLPLHTG